MKVILLQDIARMGRKHEVKQVPDGHAQNYLIPRKLALAATPQNLKWQSEHVARREAKEAMSAEAFTKFLTQVSKAPIVVMAAANEQGHLFKGLRAVDIAEALTDATGMMIASSAIELSRPIKEVGEHEITVTVGDQHGKAILSVQGTSS
jgi:large subunit ribosomal protein L9